MNATTQAPPPHAPVYTPQPAQTSRRVNKGVWVAAIAIVISLAIGIGWAVSAHKADNANATPSFAYPENTVPFGAEQRDAEAVRTVTGLKCWNDNFQIIVDVSPNFANLSEHAAIGNDWAIILPDGGDGYTINPYGEYALPDIVYTTTTFTLNIPNEVTEGWPTVGTYLVAFADETGNVTFWAGSCTY